MIMIVMLKEAHWLGERTSEWNGMAWNAMRLWEVIVFALVSFVE